MSFARRLIVLPLFVLAHAAAADTLTGTVDDPAVRRKIDLVYVEQTTAVAPASGETIFVNQHGNTYVPHVTAVVSGTTVIFKSEDPELHNVFARAAKRVLFNQAVLPAGQFERKFSALGVVHLSCNIHKEMSAYIVVLQNGFFAKPDRKTGQFTINGLPPGTYPIRIWGEELSNEQNARKLTVTVGQKGEPMRIAAR